MSVAHSETLCWLSWGTSRWLWLFTFPAPWSLFGICVFPSTLDGRWEGTWGGSLLIWIPFTPSCPDTGLHSCCLRYTHPLWSRGWHLIMRNTQIYKEFLSSDTWTPFNHPVRSVINGQPPSHPTRWKMHSIASEKYYEYRGWPPFMMLDVVHTSSGPTHVPHSITRQHSLLSLVLNEHWLIEIYSVASYDPTFIHFLFTPTPSSSSLISTLYSFINSPHPNICAIFC